MKPLPIRKPILTALRIGLPLLLTLAWLSFIFGNSLQTGVESGEQSHKVYEIVNEVTKAVGIEKNITEHFIRKAAHFTEFAVLAILFCADAVCLKLVRERQKLYFSIPILSSSSLICFICASLDEILQHFSAGRGPRVTDVLIDTSGAVCATALFILFFVLIRHIRKRRRNTAPAKSEVSSL